MHTDINEFLTTLNEQQKQAVCAKPGNTLIVAGAGSGKTRVLVHRCAWLIQEHNLDPSEIIAVTFTNKAASEMKQRIEELISQPVYGMWCGTFHGLCHRILRQHYSLANLDENFQIIDQDDQFKLIKKIQKELNLDESQWPIKKTQSMINSLKEQGKRANNAFNLDNSYSRAMGPLYQQYESICNKANWLDFAEILLRSVELLEQNTEVREHFQNTIKHILIDEFQDTNNLQYRWISCIAGNNANITAVGDDDQSIYSWRGAKVDHLIRFSSEFEDVTTIRLEQNYRSTANILQAANQVIENNENRMGKTLWTQSPQGETISLYSAYNELDESQYICQQISIYNQSGINLSEIAILYRSNAQSRIIEDQLTKANIPYTIYGGLRFFERAEIKDAIAYLRLIARHNDDAAFERIINTPSRGIGLASMNIVREIAQSEQVSLWDAAIKAIETESLTKKAIQSMQDFINLIIGLNPEKDLSLMEICENTIEHSGLIDSLRNTKNKANESKIENLTELINATRNYVASDTNIPLIIDFLNNIALDQNTEKNDNSHHSVQLMTLHASKGLEFNYVFLVGLEDGLFPHKMCFNDPNQLEEERRLCYVGMTRAMQKLHISHAESRRLYGSESYQKPSRFINEIPKELLTPVKMQTKSIQQNTNDNIYLGQKITHKYFGDGTILNSDGFGSNLKIQVVFVDHGVKWLMFEQAPISFQ